MSDSMYLIVVGLDIEGYSKKGIEHQISSQTFVEDWVISACEKSGVSESPVDINWVDTGDGGFLLIETYFNKAISFLSNFYKSLERHNRNSIEDAKINVRSAIHCDDSTRWEGKLVKRKYAGDGIVVCARILDGMSREYSNQVVCSGDYKRKVANLDVALVQLESHKDKHGELHEVWNIRVKPGLGVDVATDDLPIHPQSWGGS